MADNVEVTAGTGTSIATDDVGGAHYQKVKLALGADNAVDTLLDSGQQAMSACAPVVLASDHTDVKVTLDGEAIAGTVTANAGSNLNTSLLALESGGNLAAAVSALSAIAGYLDTEVAAIVTAVQLLDNVVSGSEAQVDVVAALPAGTNLLGRVTIDPQTANGLSMFKSLDLDESEEEVKDTAGQIYWIHVTNLADAKRYLKIYDADADDVIVGTTVPNLTIPLPTNADTNGVATVINIPLGLACANAITVAATTGFADNDTGAPGANEIIINIGFK